MLRVEILRKITMMKLKKLLRLYTFGYHNKLVMC